jgi:hypothetical protein
LGLLAVLAFAGLAVGQDAVPIAPGATHRHIYRPEGPWVINIVESELAEPLLELHSVLGGGGKVGRSALPEMLGTWASHGRIPVAAVNGDFFAMAGGAYTTIPLGLQVEEGELVTLPDPSRSVFCRLADGSARISVIKISAWLTGPAGLLYPIAGLNRPPERGELVLFTRRFGQETRAADSLKQFTLAGLSGPIKASGEVSARVSAIAVNARTAIPEQGAVLVANGVAAYGLRGLKEGDEVRVLTRVEPEMGEIRTAIGGGPRLVREGRISVENREERFADSFAARPHPRTGVGLRGGTLVMVTVDGRQPGYSEGMTLNEFAQLFCDLGCTEAMNLDGGGSTTMMVRTQVVNSPSDGAPRRVANALAIFSTAPPTGKAVRMAIEPAEANVLSGEKLALVAKGLDEYYNPVPLDQSQVRWETGRLGRMDDQGNFVAASVTLPTVGMISARQGEMLASAVVCIVPAPARVMVTPERISIAPNASQQFVAHAYDDENHPIRLHSDRVTWECEPATAGAAIGPQGLLRAPAHAAELVVRARIAGVSGEARVLVGVVTRVVEDFERPGDWRYLGVPAELPGAVERVGDPLQKGNRCLRLSYDFSKGEGTRVAEAVLDLALPDTRTLSLRVLGDGQGGWLRARLRDGADRRFTVDLAAKVDWSKEWRGVSAWLPDECAPPVRLESVYLTEYHADRRPRGEIYLDDIGAESSGQQDPPAARSAQTGGRGGERMEELPTYICRRTPEPIRIDGRLDEAVWSRAAPVGDFLFTDGKGAPQLPTEVKLCWDDRNLYLAFLAVDTDIWGTMKKRDDPIYEEEVVEAFLSSGGEVTKYYEFEWSPRNVVFDARVECPEWGDRSRMKLDTEWDCQGQQSAVQVVGTLDKRDDIDQQWTVEAALPFSQIGRRGKAPAEGEEWRANFYRIDRAGKGEFSCWSPTLKPDFHVPARFGKLVFSKRNW